MRSSTKKQAGSTKRVSTEYRGKQTKTGNSSGFRFEGALFRSHPEFKGDVVAHVIAPGRLLVTADAREQEADPVMEAFLAFLAEDIRTSPAQVRPLDPGVINRVTRLTEGVAVDARAPLEDEVDLS